MLIAVKISLFALTMVLLVRAVRFWIKYRSVRTADLSSGMLAMFYVLPIIYDAIGMGAGGGISVWPDDVQLRYCLLIMGAYLIIQVVSSVIPKRYASFHSISRQHQLPLEPQGPLRLIYQLSWVGILFPLVAVVVLANPLDYLTYGNLYNRNISGGATGRFAYTIIVYTTLIAMLCFFIAFWISLCRTRRIWSAPTVAALILAVVPVYIHGKRSIIFFVLTMAMAAATIEARMKARYVVMAACVLLVFSFIYIGNWKGLDRTAAEFVRGDLARDYTLAHAIDHSSATNSRIVPHRNAGYEFQLFFFVPRALYPDKPWPTSVYFTNHLLGIRDDGYIGWALGIGFQEEALANAGYAGWLVSCIVVGLLCGWIDRQIYCKSTYFVLLWVPFLYGHVFAFNVIFKLLLFVIVPALILQSLFTSERSWIQRNHLQGSGVS